jgi:hypothetical protein
MPETRRLEQSKLSFFLVLREKNEKSRTQIRPALSFPALNSQFPVCTYPHISEPTATEAEQ